MNLTFLEDFYDRYNISIPAQIIFSIAILFIVAFLLTRITKKLKFPNVTAYIISGIIIGPYVLNLIPPLIIDGMSFLTDLGLGFIAFSIGRFFDLKMTRKNGWKPVIISLVQSFLTGTALFFVLMPFSLPLGIDLIIASIGATTSAASTVMTIRQYNCKGEFVDYLLEIIALDNAVGIVAFSLCSGIASAMLGVAGSNISVFDTVWLPIIANFAMLLIGFLLGLLLAKVVITPTRSRDNRLILTVAIIAIQVGLCDLISSMSAGLSVSPLLGVMLFAATYKNFTSDDVLFSQVNDFGAPILLIFFVISGASFNVTYLGTVGLIGSVYFLGRLALKYVGPYLGGLLTKSSPSVRKYTGLAMIPQAGVSVGLAALASRMLVGLSGTYAEQLNAIIISSAILYELVGPALARLSLKLSGSLTEEDKLRVKGSGLVISTGSMLRDTIEVQSDPEIEKRMKQLAVIKERCDETNRYIHTKAYTSQDISAVNNDGTGENKS